MVATSRPASSRRRQRSARARHGRLGRDRALLAGRPVLQASRSRHQPAPGRTTVAVIPSHDVRPVPRGGTASAIATIYSPIARCPNGGHAPRRRQHGRVRISRALRSLVGSTVPLSFERRRCGSAADPQRGRVGYSRSAPDRTPALNHGEFAESHRSRCLPHSVSRGGFLGYAGSGVKHWD